tara:strand:+ start:508 stop:708 length:201 start_codon:yes stop_codon:yes gene_type:complete
MQSREEAIRKTAGNQKELDKLESGKKTLKSIFKSKGKKEVEIDKLSESIQTHKSSLDEYVVLVSYL